MDLGPDVTYLTAGGSRWLGLTGISRWLAIGLGDALLYSRDPRPGGAGEGEGINLSPTTLGVVESRGGRSPCLWSGASPGVAVVIDITNSNTDVAFSLT